MENQSVENGHLTKIIEKKIPKNVEPPEMIVFKKSKYDEEIKKLNY